MNYFLAKTDPDTYSLADFINEGETLWDGVHNNAAMLFIQKMKPGDAVYIYESLSTKAIVGLATVTGEPFLNTADPRRSWAVTLRFVKKYDTPLTLATLKADERLRDFSLIRQSRLSVMPVEPHYNEILQESLR
jgi:predicted RNA-binding protein with PUA-like domain